MPNFFPLKKLSIKHLRQVNLRVLNEKQPPYWRSKWPRSEAEKPLAATGGLRLYHVLLLLLLLL